MHATRARTHTRAYTGHERTLRGSDGPSPPGAPSTPSPGQTLARGPHSTGFPGPGWSPHRLYSPGRPAHTHGVVALPWLSPQAAWRGAGLLPHLRLALATWRPRPARHLPQVCRSPARPLDLRAGPRQPVFKARLLHHGAQAGAESGHSDSPAGKRRPCRLAAGRGPGVRRRLSVPDEAKWPRPGDTLGSLLSRNLRGRPGPKPRAA